MCIIINKPKGTKVSVDTLKNCWKNNPNGAGLMFSKDDKLFISKGFMTFDELLDEYSKIDPENKRVVLHFRFATHGKICKELTHPFMINDELGLVHNGIFSFDDGEVYEDDEDDNGDIEDIEDIEETERLQKILGHTDKNDNNFSYDFPIRKPIVLGNIGQPEEFDNDDESDESDTSMFCDLLKKLPHGFLNNDSIKYFISNFVSSSMSVIVFMDNKGETTTIGCDSKIEDNGVWYSNLDFQKRNKAVINTMESINGYFQRIGEEV